MQYVLINRSIRSRFNYSHPNSLILRKTPSNPLKIRCKGRNLLVGNFGVGQSSSYSRGIRKGSRYGGYLFERERKLFTENQSNELLQSAILK